MEIEILRMDIVPNRRILVTSDIHGQLSYLKNVLAKAKFCDRDLLVIIGDIVEKGPESLQTLRYIMDLHKQGNVVVLAGNVDVLRVQLIDELCADNAEAFYQFLLKSRKAYYYGKILYDEMLSELGIYPQSPEDMLSAKDKILEHFSPELDFLRSRPTVLETQNFIFVHGGLPEAETDKLAGYDAMRLLKFDDFRNAGMRFDKFVVVGHWPVFNYKHGLPSYDPIIDTEEKIISIDGGSGLKVEGQLNMLAIPDIDCKANELINYRYDAFPVYHAASSQETSTDFSVLTWMDGSVRVLEKDNGFSYVEHIRTGQKMWVYDHYLYENDTHCADYTDYVLPIQAGDEVSLLHSTPRGHYVKHNGVFGWYSGELI
ncbi:MAG: metallophosphoesterase [Clostridiales bacterium]|nr:metallophosphoesterase [Clostridiales bacterium]